jgi:small conductance mechanosensitive channel
VNKGGEGGRKQRTQRARPVANQRARRVPDQRARSGRAHSLRKPARAYNPRDLRQSAQSRLKRFRQGSILAVAITGMLLLAWGQPADDAPAAPETTAVAVDPITDPSVSLQQATHTIRDLLLGLYGVLPKLVIVIVLFVAAIFVARLSRVIVERALGRWERAEAIAALVRIAIFVATIGAAMSVLAGDVRALIGSLGLIGLALSWALQTPIESFTGWLLNSFRGYYRVGDRIEVGEVFGDVYKIDVLTTTVWEAGGPGKAVAGAQSTGAMITFPNWEVLRSNVVNYSRDFPFVWDEVTLNIANESDLRYAVAVFESAARRVIGPLMTEPAARYRQLLERAKLAFEVEEEPRVFVSLADSWTDCTVRYLVPARARRRWSSALVLALTEESSRPEHRGKIIPAYPRTEVRMSDDWPSAPQPPDKPE